jgi:hypothetical protein
MLGLLFTMQVESGWLVLSQDLRHSVHVPLYEDTTSRSEKYWSLHSVTNTSQNKI